MEKNVNAIKWLRTNVKNVYAKTVIKRKVVKVCFFVNLDVSFTTGCFYFNKVWQSVFCLYHSSPYEIVHPDKGFGMSDRLVLVKTYSKSFDAQFDKGRLEDEGISSYLFDENTVTMYFLYDNALGGIKLMVKENDFVKAKDVLFTQFVDNENETTNEQCCPFCNSKNIEKDLKGLRSVKSIIAYLFTCVFFNVYPIITDKVCICKDCNRSFAQKED